VVNGSSAESLLDTYQAERHPIGARVLKLTMAATALGRGDERTKALHEKMAELLAMNEPRKRYAAMISGLDVHYDLGAGHPLLGRRMPDLELVTLMGHAECSRCCTRRDRCCSILESRARSTSLHGRSAFDASMLATPVRGAAGARRGGGSDGGVDSARRSRRLGRRRQ